MNKSTFITLAVLVFVLIAVGLFTFSSRNTNLDVTDSEAGKSLSSTIESTYTDLNGKPINLDVYAGKVRVVNSWASWCPFCVKELADFQTLASEYADAEVVVIAINRKESNDRAKSFLSTLGALDDVVFVQDLTDTFYQSIGGFSMPETVFYDKQGNISTHKRGVMTLEEMRTLTEKAIGPTNTN